MSDNNFVPPNGSVEYMIAFAATMIDDTFENITGPMDTNQKAQLLSCLIAFFCAASNRVFMAPGEKFEDILEDHAGVAGQILHAKGWKIEDRYLQKGIPKGNSS